MLFGELSELAGQRNAIDGRIVEIVAELDRDELCGATGARSVAALVAWKLGASSGNAKTIATVAHRLAEFPRCAQVCGRVGCRWIRSGSSPGGRPRDLMSIMRSWPAVATVNQLRTAVKLEPRPEPEPDADPDPEPGASITKTSDEKYTY